MAYVYNPNSNTTTFGDWNPAVGALQTQLNTQHAGQAGWTPLTVDYKYGPLTQAAMNFHPSNIISSTGYRTDLANTSSELDKLGTESDPYMQLFARMNAANQSEYDTTAKNITHTGAETEKGIITESERYKAGLETLGIKSGLSEHAPELQLDRMVQASSDERRKIADLQDKEELALANAKQAKLNGDLATMKEQLDYAKSIRKEKADAMETALNRKGKEIDIAESIAPWVYQQIQGMDEAQKAAFLQKTADEFGITNISALIGAANTYNLKKKATGTSGGYSALELRKLRAAGIDSTDIKKADEFLYGASEDSSTSSQDPTERITEEAGSDKKLWQLAIALGIPRKTNLSKKNEIDSLFANSTLVDYIQAQLDSGNSIDDIIAANQ